MDQEHLYSMALTKIANVSVANARILYDRMGSATAVFENRGDIKSYIPDVNQRLVDNLQNVDYALKRAEQEMEFIRKSGIKLIDMSDDAYPQKLKTCDDAPIVLYYYGNADLNTAKIISMVGTRKCTEYGKDLCRTFVSDLKKYYPDALIVSGLAYGIDIQSHKAALDCGMNTVAVLAHGLDRVYPSVHRKYAVEMVKHGGLLTEYMSGTTPERGNFISRNRIVAGICDACIVVESANKGGSLITANLAQSYDRDVFAFPGKIYDEYSEGCNKLIKNHKASMILSAEDFIETMGWPNPLEEHKSPVQRELFVSLTDEEQLIVNNLNDAEEKGINIVVNETGLSYSKVTALMFELELKGVVKVLGGARYRLLK